MLQPCWLAALDLAVLEHSSTFFTGWSRRMSLVSRAQKDSTEQIKEQVKDVAEDAKGSLNQLLGIRGASESTNIWKIRLQLTKPVTWVPLIWGAHTLP